MQTQQSHIRDKSKHIRSLGKPVGAFEARRTFGRLIEEAYYQKDAFIIERSGRPMAQPTGGACEPDPVERAPLICARFCHRCG